MESIESFPLEEQFDRYLNKQMEREAQQQFEQRLETEPELRASLQSYLAGKRAAWLAGYQDEKKVFEQKLKDRQQRTRKLRSFRYAIIGLAAALALLLAFIYWPGAPASSPTPESLYAAYFEPPVPPAQMGRAPNLSLKEADELFRQQAYREAAQAYGQLLQQAEVSPLSLSRIQLMLGICQLQTGAPDEARRSLARAGQHREQAQWYTALSWLKEEKVAEARKALQLIEGQEGHFYQQQATELLKKLP
jgi:hypothetical protein